MKENSIEKDEEILNNIKAYMQENIDNGCHKFVYNDLGYDEKCVDVINAIEHILSDYKRVLKENKELQEDRNKFKKALGKRITYCNELEKDLFENGSNYVIPKQKVKDKIEELKQERDETYTKFLGGNRTDENLSTRGKMIEGGIKVLQELLEESEE